jgi:hypothetical protein
MTTREEIGVAMQHTRPVRVAWHDKDGNERSIIWHAPSEIATNAVISILSGGAKGNDAVVAYIDIPD